MIPNLVDRAPATLLLLFLGLLGAPSPVWSQEPIKDNSFLIEEAYNQGRGIVQHINTFSRPKGGGAWIYTLTQEWPAPDERHQLSFSLPIQRLEPGPLGKVGLGDIALNYRYQAVGREGGDTAFSPRLSVLLATGDATRGMGAGGMGLQVNLPLSHQVNSRLVTHWNAGATRTFSAQGAAGAESDTMSYSLGQSFVWLAAPRFNLLVETVWARAQEVTGPSRTTWSNSVFISPGLRWSHDFKNGLQIVPGIAFPIGVGPSRGERSAFLYLSFEHSFRRSR